MNFIIYIIAFLEGFTTLSVEIVALRSFTPIIGSNSISTSIILGVILLALSYGYYIGGKIATRKINIQTRLIQNLLCSALYYYFISFILYKPVLEGLLQVSGSYMFSILFSSLLLFFIPVFLASQTIPLLSKLIIGGENSENIGKLLFYSTVGSFLGSVLTSSVLFALIGVEKTALVSPILLLLCAVLIAISYKLSMKIKIITAVLLLTCSIATFTSNYSSHTTIYQKSNAYHTIEIVESGNRRALLQNKAYASGIYIDSKESFFPYINEATRQVENIRPKNVLIIGAAGFTFPHDISRFDFVERIDVVDVDGSLKDISEKYFLQEPLSEKIHFYAEPSRFFINHTENSTYDFILIDVYSGKSLPPQVLTYEFFDSLTRIGKSIYLNIIFDVDQTSRFSQKLLSTINAAFGNSFYKNFSANHRGEGNVFLTNTPSPGYIENTNSAKKEYSDHLHSIELDLFEMK